MIVSCRIRDGKGIYGSQFRVPLKTFTLKFKQINVQN